jgi:hypothetical protein
MPVWSRPPRTEAGAPGSTLAIQSSLCTNDGSGVAELADLAARNTDAEVMWMTGSTTTTRTPTTSWAHVPVRARVAGAATAVRAKRLLTGVVALVFVVTGCATGTTVSGSGGPAATAPPPQGAGAPPPAAPGTGRATESREVSGFTGVELASIGDLRIEQTGTESLMIEADADILPQLTSNVSSGILKLGVAPGTTIATSGRIVYHLTVATLDSVAVSGAGDATASNLRAGRLTVEISGAGDMTLAGTADSQAVTISGTGDYNGEDLQSATAAVTIDAAGDAVLRVSDRLDATVSGVGSVEYIGDPRVTKDINGVGSVEQR